MMIILGNFATAFPVQKGVLPKVGSYILRKIMIPSILADSTLYVNENETVILHATSDFKRSQWFIGIIATATDLIIELCAQCN